MFCTNCGSQVPEGTAFCPNCGVKIERPETKEPPVRREPVYQTPPPAYQASQPIVIQHEITQDQLPAKFRPLSAWAYFGYGLLFAVPIVGFIFLIIFSCSGANINRRSFARSYWCGLILCAIVVGIVLIIAAATGSSIALSDWLK